jgi:hypothetical protein
MTKPLNSGQRLARGVAIIAAVEPEADAQIRNEQLFYGDCNRGAYDVKVCTELTALGWYQSEGSWAFYT